MVQKKRILLIEDEEDIASLLKMQADMHGYKVLIETDGQAGLRTAERELPDLIILDVMLPGLNGLDVCRKLKHNAETKHIPIILLTAKSEEIDIVLGLELGADDYVTKPFSPKVLFSRAKAVLRRQKEPETSKRVVSFGEYALDIDRYLLRKQNKQVPLTLSEFGILKRLIQNRGKVLTRNQLLNDIHNDDALIVDRNIDVHIAALRRKLGPNFNWVETVRGVGYRFKESDEAEASQDLEEAFV